MSSNLHHYPRGRGPGRWRLIAACSLLLACACAPFAAMAQDAAATAGAPSPAGTMPPARHIADARAAQIELAPYLTWLRDADRALTPAQARAALAQGRFLPLPARGAQFGFTGDDIWLAVALANPGDTPLARTLVLGHPRLDHIDLVIDEPAGTREVALGDAQPFAARARPLTQPNTALTLAPGSTTTVLARVRSSSSVQVPAALYDDSALASVQARHVAIDALYFGLLAGLMLYNLALYVAMRSRTYLWYVLYVLAFAGLMLAYTGVGFAYLWPESPRFANFGVPAFSALLIAASSWFQRDFLDLRHTAPRFDPIFRYGTFALLALALASFVLPVRVATVISNVGTMIMSLLAYAAAMVCVLRGFRPARYFLLAWTVLFLGGVFVPLKNFGLVAPGPVIDHALQIGSALEMVLLAFALAYRINLLREDNERLQGEARHSLETRVGERTRELHRALSELELANRHLRESSRRDGLTGVYNRRHLDDVLDHHVSGAQLHGLPLSLLMIDIDRFKAINDRHGHAAGDECLRAVAARLAAMVEEAHAEAFVARYGGEEFAVMLPQADGVSASSVAERMRHTIARVPVATGAGDVPITISVGVATLSVADGTASALLQRADEALYEAKRAGRNQVIAA